MLRKSKVVVFVRHAATCEHREDENYPKCDCPKWLRWSRAGKQHRKPADTRTWGVAEQRAAEKQEELNSGAAPIPKPETGSIRKMAITFMMRKSSEGIQFGTEQKVQRHIECFEKFMAGRGRFAPEDLTVEDVVLFKSTWSVSWKSALTRQKAQQNIRSFVRFLGRPDLLDSLGKIKKSRADEERLEPRPFTEEELKKLLSQVPVTFPEPKEAALVTARIHLMVSTGLALRDSGDLKKSSINKDGWLRVKRQKTRKEVLQKLDPALVAELARVSSSHPVYVFYPKAEHPERSITKWGKDLKQVMKDADVYILGNVSHRFRDTFVDTALGKGWSMTDVASALADTLTVVEAHYHTLATKRREERILSLPAVRTW